MGGTPADRRQWHLSNSRPRACAQWAKQAAIRPFTSGLAHRHGFHNFHTGLRATHSQASLNMLDKLSNSLDFHTQALVLRAERQRVIASNIANADTPGFAAREMNFSEALREAVADGGRDGTATDGRSHAGHLPMAPRESDAGSRGLVYATQTQPRLDGNSVDLDRERASFVDNAVRYEATLRFINGQGKTMLSAITGQ